LGDDGDIEEGEEEGGEDEEGEGAVLVTAAHDDLSTLTVVGLREELELRGLTWTTRERKAALFVRVETAILRAEEEEEEEAEEKENEGEVEGGDEEEDEAVVLGGKGRGGDRERGVGEVSAVWEAINRHQLATFLAANVLTGIVNLSIRTLDYSATAAYGVLLVHMAVVCVVPIGLEYLPTRGKEAAGAAGVVGSVGVEGCGGGAKLKRA
jgi:hypothetical protein